MNPQRIFILTGAGVSAESGLGTFRDKGGLWSRYRIEDVASLDGYRRNPQAVLDFYNMRRSVHAEAAPNTAHLALARLQAEWAVRGGSVTLCTQNIDNLHERGGAARVIHMHGEVNKARCHDCGDITSIDGDLVAGLGCAACGRTGGMRPHVVWFGETPLYMNEIFEALAEADLFVAIGTSGAVYPASGFVTQARRAGIRTLELNLEPSDNARLFDDAHYGPATEIVPVWAEGLIGSD